MKNTTPPRATRATRATRSADTKQPYGMPTPEQIAMLAATLAKFSNVNLLAMEDRPARMKLLAYAALNLWQAAEAVHLEWSEDYRSPLDNAEYLATLPQYPMTRDDFLKLALPSARSEDRKRAWKHYNCTLAGIDPQTATIAQQKEADEKWKSPLTHADFILLKTHFLTWWTPYHAAEVSKTRSEARKPTKKVENKALSHS